MVKNTKLVSGNMHAAPAPVEVNRFRMCVRRACLFAWLLGSADVASCGYLRTLNLFFSCSPLCCKAWIPVMLDLMLLLMGLLNPSHLLNTKIKICRLHQPTHISDTKREVRHMTISLCSCGSTFLQELKSLKFRTLTCPLWLCSFVTWEQTLSVLCLLQAILKANRSE